MSRSTPNTRWLQWKPPAVTFISYAQRPYSVFVCFSSEPHSKKNFFRKQHYVCRFVVEEGHVFCKVGTFRHGGDLSNSGDGLEYRDYLKTS